MTPSKAPSRSIISGSIVSTAVIASLVVGLAPAHAQIPPPIVSPDRVPDVPPTPPGQSPFPFFDNFSWRAFIALNWPAMPGTPNRGQPDRTRAFGDTRGPRVWQTWKSRYEIFQPSGAIPAPWASYAGQNPCSVGFSNEVTTLSSFSAFSDFNQAAFSLSKLGNPLVAQNQTYVRYEVRANRQEFDSIVGNKWYLAANLPGPNNAVPFNTQSIEVKASWRILTDKDTPAIRGRYYVVPRAQVFDIVANKCVLQDIALVGFHIVVKTPDRPQWIWSTFEQIDNVPGLTSEPKPPPGIPFSFNNPGQPQTLNPPRGPTPISSINPPVANPAAMQVVRKQRIQPDTMNTNAAFWNLPQIKGTVWQNYMLVSTQWPTQIAPESPSNNGVPFPSGGSEIANTTMETYFQFDGGSCMDCHTISNSQGRDFVMFVTMDAFRPTVAAPSEAFSAKIAAEQANQTATALDNDPLVKALADFFDAAKTK
jgi:hypothetical protein